MSERKEPGESLYEAHIQHLGTKFHEPWRQKTPEMRAFYAEAESTIRADERAKAYEDAAKCAAQWRKVDELLLRAGEMTAQEIRTAKAVAGGIESAIRAKIGKSNV